MKGAIAFRGQVGRGHAYATGGFIYFPNGDKGKIKKLNMVEGDLEGRVFVTGWYVPLEDSDSTE